MWYSERANTQSNSPHHASKIASIQGDPIVFGGINSIKTERLNWSNDVAKGYKTILYNSYNMNFTESTGLSGYDQTLFRNIHVFLIKKPL